MACPITYGSHNNWSEMQVQWKRQTKCRRLWTVLTRAWRAVVECRPCSGFHCLCPCQTRATPDTRWRSTAVSHRHREANYNLQRHLQVGRERVQSYRALANIPRSHYLTHYLTFYIVYCTQRLQFVSCSNIAMTDWMIVVTFRLSRRRREMYCGHARLCVCVCVCMCVSVRYRMPTLLHGQDVTWRSGRECP